MTTCTNCNETWDATHLSDDAWLESLTGGDHYGTMTDGRRYLMDALCGAIDHYGPLAAPRALEALASRGPSGLSPWPWLVAHGHGCPACGVADITPDLARWLVARLWVGLVGADVVSDFCTFDMESKYSVEAVEMILTCHPLELAGTDHDDDTVVAVANHGDLVALFSMHEGERLDPADIGWRHGTTFGYPLVWVADGEIVCESCAPTPGSFIEDQIWRLSADGAIVVSDRTDDGGFWVMQDEPAEGEYCGSCHETISEPTLELGQDEDELELDQDEDELND